MLDRNITSKLRVFDPSISTFIRLYHTKTKLPRTIQPSRCVPVFFTCFIVPNKTKPSNLKGVREVKNCTKRTALLFRAETALFRRLPHSRGFCVWFVVFDYPPALAANQAWVSAVTELASPENCFYCKWEPTKLQGKIFDKAAGGWGGMFRWKRLFCLLSASKKINICQISKFMLSVLPKFYIYV